MVIKKSKGQKRTTTLISSQIKSTVSDSSSLSPIIGSIEPISISKPQIPEISSQETQDERRKKILAMLSLEYESDSSSDESSFKKQNVPNSEEEEEEKPSSEEEPLRKVRFHPSLYSLPITPTPTPSIFFTTPQPVPIIKKVHNEHWKVDDDDLEEEPSLLIRRPRKRESTTVQEEAKRKEEGEESRKRRREEIRKGKNLWLRNILRKPLMSQA